MSSLNPVNILHFFWMRKCRLTKNKDHLVCLNKFMRLFMMLLIYLPFRFLYTFQLNAVALVFLYLLTWKYVFQFTTVHTERWEVITQNKLQSECLKLCPWSRNLWLIPQKFNLYIPFYSVFTEQQNTRKQNSILPNGIKFLCLTSYKWCLQIFSHAFFVCLFFFFFIMSCLTIVLISLYTEN